MRKNIFVFNVIRGCFHTAERMSAREFERKFSVSYRDHAEKGTEISDIFAYDNIENAVDFIFSGQIDNQRSAEICFHIILSRRELNKFFRYGAENYGDYTASEVIEKAIKRAARKRDHVGDKLHGLFYAAQIEKEFSDLE